MFRKLENIKEKILEGTLKIGATKGVPAISARTVAVACDISTHTIYENFKSMADLISEIAKGIKQGHLNFLASLIEQGKDYPYIFDAFMDRFINNSQETLFYTSYLHTLIAPLPLQNSQEILQASKSLFKKKMTDEELYLVWDYVRVESLYYAKNIILGIIPNTKSIREDIRNITLNGLEYFH